MFRYHPRVEEAILEGQPIFLVGSDPHVLARRLNELCRRHTKEIPFWVVSARDLAAVHDVQIGDSMIVNSGAAQTQAVIAALRHDPDGLIAAPLFPEASENFLRALLSGHNFGVYATLESASVAEAVTAWRAAGLPDDVLAPALDDILFIEWHGTDCRYVEAELLDGLLDVWEPEGLEPATPRLRLVTEENATPTPMAPLTGAVTEDARGPATRLSAAEVHSWVQERARTNFDPARPRPAFIPLTEEIEPADTMKFVTYARAVGHGELILQLHADNLPPGFPGRPAAGAHLQFFVAHRAGRREYHMKMVTERERRQAPVGFPSGSYLRGLFRVKNWLEIQDYPDNAAPFTKAGGWPVRLDATKALFFQIDTEAHEFEVALGLATRAFVFFDGVNLDVTESKT